MVTWQWLEGTGLLPKPELGRLLKISAQATGPKYLCSTVSRV